MDIPQQVAALQITPEMLRLIAEIDEFKGTWRALRAIAPERLERVMNLGYEPTLLPQALSV